MITKKIILILLFVFVLTPNIIFAVDCPRGLVNDPAPGICGLYIDTNNDGYCDLSEQEEPAFLNNEENSTPEPNDHKIGLISIILILLYIAGLIAVSKNKISVISHRKFWNWVLLILFMPTLLTSLFLALLIEFGITINTGINLGYWHFVFGWAFLLVSVFHILWHLSYYFKIFRK